MIRIGLRNWFHQWCHSGKYLSIATGNGIVLKGLYIVLIIALILLETLKVVLAI